MKCVLRPFHNIHVCSCWEVREDNASRNVFISNCDFLHLVLSFIFIDVFKNLKILKTPMLLYLPTTNFIYNTFWVFPTEYYVFLKYLDQTYVILIEWRENWNFLSDLNLRIKAINLTKNAKSLSLHLSLANGYCLLGFSVQEAEGQICAQL
jgi:hypothetical protein